jgi:hypothetical protein
MKNRLFFIGLLTLSFNFNAQMWGPATPFPPPSGGFDPNSNGLSTEVNSICVYNNELYIGGNFTGVGGIVAHCIARWNGNVWNSLGNGDLLQNTRVRDLEVYDNKLYISSDKLYKWDGNSIQEVTFFNSIIQQNVSIPCGDLHVFNGELYIATSSRIFKYNSTTNETIEWEFINANCIDDFNNSLYIGTSEGLFKYQSGNWINCNGITTSIPEIFDIENYNGELHVLGSFTSIGGLTIKNIAKFNGNNWSNYPSSMPYNIPTGVQNSYPVADFGANTYATQHLKVINNELYLAHSIAPLQQLSPLIKFNGSQWIPIANNFCSGGTCSAFYNGELFVGGASADGFGFFSSIDNNPVGLVFTSGIAKLNPTVGSLESLSNELEISLYPNPTSNNITIQGKEGMNQNFKIFDQMGREVISGKLNGMSTEVNLSTLSKGMYTLKIEGNYQPAQIVKE